MSSISNRMPGVVVAWDGPAGQRLTKTFDDPYGARAFYARKLTEGRHPKVEADAATKDWKKRQKLAAETLAAIRELERVQQAVREGRAYLDTFVGRRKVVSYNHSTGDAVTNNTGDLYDRRTFCVCLIAIKTEP